MMQFLLENFDTLAEIPGGVPKLREIILQLAARGELTRDWREQNPDVEPASVLLEKIQAEKAQLEKGRMIRKQKLFPPVSGHEVPYAIPETWQWVRWGNISHDVQYGYTAKADFSISEVRYLRITDIQDDKVNWDSVPGCKIDPSQIDLYRLNEGDLVVARTGGTIGKTYLVEGTNDFPVVFASYLIRISVSTINIPKYIKIFSLSGTYWNQLYEGSKGTGQPNVNGKTLSAIYFPLPTQPEQKVIVERVNHLMQLCDTYETEQKKRETTRRKAVQANLAALSNSNGAEKKECWGRVKEHFGDLCKTPGDVAELKATILQLAVRGELTRDWREQNPDVESASVLLEKIRAEKVKLEKEGKIKKQKQLSPVDEDEIPYEVPETWEWCRFGSCTVNRDSERVPLSREERQHRQGPYNYYGASGVIDHIDGFLFDKPLLLIGEDGANLVNRSTPIAYIVEGKYWVNNHAHVLDGISLDFLNYIKTYINSISLLQYITGTAQPKMNQAKMNSIPVPLPPYSEQETVIQRVDQLLKLCDGIELAILKREETGERLWKAVASST